MILAATGKQKIWGVCFVSKSCQRYAFFCRSLFFFYPFCSPFLSIFSPTSVFSFIFVYVSLLFCIEGRVFLHKRRKIMLVEHFACELRPCVSATLSILVFDFQIQQISYPFAVKLRKALRKAFWTLKQVSYNNLYRE